MKKALIKISVIFLAFFFCGASCDDMANAKWGIWVENQSDKEVLFVFSFDLRNGKLHPSTAWPKEPSTPGYDIHQVNPRASRPIDYPSQHVADFLPGEEIAVFVFDPDSVAKYSWRQLELDQNYLKKYIFAERELGNGLVYP